MDRFQEMKLFLATAETLSFAVAARRLGTSPPTVTRAVAALEERLGTLLLSRTTRSVHLTEAGERYAEDCRRILAELEEAEEAAAGSYAEPRGTLAITAPVLFGELFVVPIMLEFLAAHPAVNIRGLLVDRVVNMVDEGLDVAVRIGTRPDATQTGSPVGYVRRMVVATPDFLAQHGVPEQPAQLQALRVVAPGGIAPHVDWHFVDRRQQGVEEPLTLRLEPTLSVTSNHAAILAATQGFGLTRILSYQVAEQLARGQLVPVLERFEPSPLPIHVVVQGGRRQPGRVLRFVDLCVQRLRAHPALGSNASTHGLPEQPPHTDSGVQLTISTHESSLESALEQET